MANLIPDSFIEMLLSRVDIVDVINSRITLQKKGKNYTARCPFHAEKTPSFSIDQKKQFYYCFGCGVSGDAIKFLREMDGLTFVEAVESLASQVGMQVPKESTHDHKEYVSKEIYDLLIIASDFFKEQLKQNPSSKQAINYLKSRGLSGNVAKEFNLGYAPSGWENLKQYILQNTNFTLEQLEQAGLLIKKEKSSYDRFRNRIMFPIRDRKGRVVGFGARVVNSKDEPKYLNSPETIVFNKGRELYGLYELKASNEKFTKLIIVEGYMDVLALYQENIKNVVAVLGTALTAENIKILFKIVPEIIFCFDGDNAGRKAAWKALEVCLPNIKAINKVSFLFLPESEDPDSYVKKYGRNKFLSQIQRAPSLADFFFSHLTSKTDLDVIEDRASVVSHAKELLNQVTDYVFKQMMFDRLASLTSLDSSYLIDKKQQKQVYNLKSGGQVYKKQPIQLPKSPAIIALSLLLTYPKLIELLTENDIEQYREINLKGSKLLFHLSYILKKNPKASIDDIKSALPDDIARKFIPEELKNFALFVPKSGIEQEFLAIIAKIRELYNEQLLESLLLKSKDTKLSVDEKVQLQQLFRKKDAKDVAE